MLKKMRSMLPPASLVAAALSIAASMAALAPIAHSQTNNQCDQPGESPDVIVGDLVGAQRWGTVAPLNDITSYSIGTTSCNIGTCWLSWISSTSEHPVIGQNLFRLKDGRFEQIGQSWLKHASVALQGSVCSSSCLAGPSDHLGVNCSDPYGSGLNGSQSRLGPKFEVNPYTGEFPYPATNMSQTGDAIYKRLQVHNVDLDPTLNAGALYFAEGQYVTHDDATGGNGANNASYRPATVTGSSGTYDLALAGTTQRQRMGIQAWKDTDPSVTLTNANPPGDGLFVVGAKATALGGGIYHYEYAIQNLSSNRAAQSFSVPIPQGAVVTNIAFHDVDYHSGEPFDGTDWSPSLGPSSVAWTTPSFDQNPNANALRWGTLYNFRFDANVGPATNFATLGLFNPGFPAAILVSTVTPSLCNQNGICDPGETCGNCAADCFHQGGGSGCCGNTTCDVGENPCRCATDCGSQQSTEGACGNGIDDDCDGLTDCTDPNCCTSLACAASDSDGDHFAAVCDCNDTNAAVYPGAPQICDGVNDDCSAPGWPTVPANEADADGDGHRICAGDCDDGNPQVWATPGEARSLTIARDGSTGSVLLSWSAPLAPGGSLVGYDTLRSPADDDFMVSAVCIESNGADTTSTDASPTPPGTAAFYLVRARNACPAGQGSLGIDSNGTPRPGRTCP